MHELSYLSFTYKCKFVGNILQDVTNNCTSVICEKYERKLLKRHII